MKPVIGPAHIIISQALRLGILCRPVYHDTRIPARVSSGEALEVSRDAFWLVDGSGGSYRFNPSPEELTLDWELSTKDIIVSEWDKSQGDPF